MAEEVEVNIECPNIGYEAKSVHVTEESIDEGEVFDGAEGGDETGVGERGEGEALWYDVAAVVAVGEVETRVAEEYADETIVVDAKDAAI